MPAGQYFAKFCKIKRPTASTKSVCSRPVMHRQGCLDTITLRLCLSADLPFKILLVNIFVSQKSEECKSFYPIEKFFQSAAIPERIFSYSAFTLSKRGAAPSRLPVRSSSVSAEALL